MLSRLTDWRTLRIARPSSEKLLEVDDGLVAQVDRAQTELLVQRAQPLAGADGAELQAARRRERLQLGEQAGKAASGPTGSPESSSTPFSIR